MHHCNKSELAGIFGVTIQTIDQWVRDGLPPVERSDRKGVEWKFETSQAINWKIEHAIKRDREGRKRAPGRAPTSDGDPIRDAQARKLIAEAEIKEQKAALAKREVARIEDIERAMSSAVVAAKTRFMGIPSSLAPLVAIESDPEDCKRILEVGVREALDELSGISLDPDFEDLESEDSEQPEQLQQDSE